MSDFIWQATSGECHFAQNLRKLRLLRKPRLSQERLAHNLGVCRSTLANYEQGRRTPPAWFVFCTAAYFGVAVDELFNGIPETASTGKGENLKNESITHGNAQKNRR